MYPHKIINMGCTFLYLFMGWLTNFTPLIGYENRRVQINFPRFQKFSKYHYKYIYLFILLFFTSTNFGLYIQRLEIPNKSQHPIHITLIAAFLLKSPFVFQK
jgi:hypothetical protein